MKVLVQNRIDWFTEVQLPALAAFQGEQTDGRLGKNLGEEEGEKKKHQVLVGIVQIQLLEMMYTLANFSWISYNAFGLAHAPSANVNSKGKLQSTELKQTEFISGFVISVVPHWHRPGTQSHQVMQRPLFGKTHFGLICIIRALIPFQKSTLVT